MNESIVKVENLSHRYNLQWAVKDINFELTRSGIYGLLGANGAEQTNHHEYHLWGIKTDTR